MSFLNSEKFFLLLTCAYFSSKVSTLGITIRQLFELV